MSFAKLVKGNKIADKKLTQIEDRKPSNENLKLTILLIGNSTSSQNFIKQKEEIGESIGIKIEVNRYSQNVNEEKVISDIEHLNQAEDVNGILIQLPLPPHLGDDRTFEKLTPEKDVDCLTPLNQGKLARNSSELKPAAVEGINYIFEYFDINLKGKDITIINNSNLIGKPLAFFLTQKGATVSICHKNTRNLKKYTRNTDILITATGKAELIGKEHVSKDTFVIDAGYGFKNGSAIGDVKDEVKEVASYYTPVPGGVGPLTVAATMENLIKCYEKQSKK